jgi:ABC-2 type transport system ATP-binding protein
MRSGRIIADTTPKALLAETGTADPDAAFLALIERDSRTQDRRPPGTTRRERREAAE